MQVFDKSSHILGFRALRIEIFIAQDQDTVGLACPFKRRPEGSRVAEMKQPGWRRGETATIAIRSGIHATILC